MFNIINFVRNFTNKIENEKLTDELNHEIEFRRQVNMIMTMDVLRKYIRQDHLERTGLLYSINDPYILTQAQCLFWEWKNEGIINEFEDFEDATKQWIIEYA